MKKVPYTSIVDSLIYFMVYTRPDITHVVGMVSQFLFNLGKEHWSTVKLILMYLKSTSSFNLCFGMVNMCYLLQRLNTLLSLNKGK
jgi:hypothetical protein